jgi:Kef-type K+ transport system membrane component KefB
VGIGMISRGEVGLIVAGVAITAGAITESTYAAIIGMIMITTILTPIWLKRTYDKDAALGIAEDDESFERDPPDYIPTYPL